MKYVIFDIEGNGLLDTITKIHCLSYKRYDNTTLIERGSFTSYPEIINFVLGEETLAGHNIVTYDIPVLEKILNIKIRATLIDTLALSWYLYPERMKHGLELWGTELGVEKPKITNWEDLEIEDYVHRCESDTDINALLFHKQLTYLSLIYEDKTMIEKLIAYLSFKMDCVREQEEVKCSIDRPLIEKSLRELYIMQKEKVDILKVSMPLNIKHKTTKKPAKMIKKDGTLSVTGTRWLDILNEHNLPQDYEADVQVLVSKEQGNPSSPIQVKNWLFSLGWIPKVYKYTTNSKDEPVEVPQVYVESEVCDSIKELYEDEPTLESLDMLSLINHRIGVFNSFLDNVDSNDKIVAGMHGFTNTLRLRHVKPIANLPKIFKFYGEEIRGAIIAPSDEYVLCGSDMSSLEDSTKQHYMYFFDPEYVKQMRVPGFDPHLDIAVLAKMLTVEQTEEHKLYDKTKGKEGVDHSKVRGNAKTVNFAGVYGAGPPKIALSTGMSLRQAKQLHATYWERNKAVKQVSSGCTVKTVNNQKWLYNPVSKFWYSLRVEKDRFSTLNQGTGVYCFDSWVREVRSRGIRIMLQYHDEIAFPLYKGKEEETDTILKDAITTVNKRIKLNVELGISVDFGDNYAQIH